MRRFIANAIGPFFLAAGFAVWPNFIEYTPESQGYLVFLALWGYAIGYLDCRNKPWADSL